VPRLIAIAPYGKGIPISDIKEGKNSGFERDSVVYSPIPGSEEEVKAIDKIYNEVTFFKKQVTESRFKQVAGSYNIIHIASHGIVDNENPLFSKILLKPQKDSTEDGLLNTYEVYSLHLNTPLVVLSACNTGYGKLYKGEGIMSMARGFIVAGAQDVVMTLWSVADKTSNELMKGFYNYLSQSNTVNVALQNAKNDYLSNADNIKSHPYFWAGYVSVGNSDMKFANPNRKSFSWMIFVSAVLLLSGIIIFYRNRLKLWK
jgi:CHAT domain-containing protein